MRVLALLCALLIGAQAHAQSNPALFQGLRPVYDLDFTSITTLPAGWTFTRASTLNDFNCASPPVLTSFAINTPALGVCDPATGTRLGLGMWTTSTIQNTWARDLTQSAAWVTNGNMTVALNQTGIDGSANAASSLTATGDNAFICHTPVGASSINRVFSAFVKRLVGSGEIDMSQDGLNWTRVDGSINSAAYARIPGGGHAQQVANAKMCFRIGTSSDSIAVDGVNSETDTNFAAFAPSPVVLTTNTANVVRSPDQLTLPLSNIPGLTVDNFTVLVQFMLPQWAGGGPTGAGPANRLAFEVDDGTTNNGIYGRTQSQSFGNTGSDNDFNISTQLNGAPPSGVGKTRCSSIPSNQLAGLTAPLPEAFASFASGYSLTGLGVSCNNGVGSGNQPETVGQNGGLTAGQLTRLTISSPAAVAAPLNGYIQRITIFNGRFTSGQLTALAAKYAPKVPSRTPGYFPLNDGTGGFLTWITGDRMQCNHC